MHCLQTFMMVLAIMLSFGESEASAVFAVSVLRGEPGRTLVRSGGVVRVAPGAVGLKTTTLASVC